VLIYNIALYRYIILCYKSIFFYDVSLKIRLYASSNFSIQNGVDSSVLFCTFIYSTRKFVTTYGLVLFFPFQLVVRCRWGVIYLPHNICKPIYVWTGECAHAFREHSKYMLRYIQCEIHKIVIFNRRLLLLISSTRVLKGVAQRWRDIVCVISSDIFFVLQIPVRFCIMKFLLENKEKNKYIYNILFINSFYVLGKLKVWFP